MVNIVEAEYMLEVIERERGTIVLFRRKMRMQDELAWREHIFLEGGIPRSPERPPPLPPPCRESLKLFTNGTVCLVSCLM